MNQITADDLQDRLARYLDSVSTLREFRDWFDSETWGLAAEPDSLVRRIAGEIELRFAEFAAGHLTEMELRSQLENLLSTTDFQLPITYKEPLVVMTSA